MLFRYSLKYFCLLWVWGFLSQYLSVQPKLALNSYPSGSASQTLALGNNPQLKILLYFK